MIFFNIGFNKVAKLSISCPVFQKCNALADFSIWINFRFLKCSQDTTHQSIWTDNTQNITWNIWLQDKNIILIRVNDNLIYDILYIYTDNFHLLKLFYVFVEQSRENIMFNIESWQDLLMANLMWRTAHLWICQTFFWLIISCRKFVTVTSNKL